MASSSASEFGADVGNCTSQITGSHPRVLLHFGLELGGSVSAGVADVVTNIPIEDRLINLDSSKHGKPAFKAGLQLAYGEAREHGVRFNVAW